MGIDSATVTGLPVAQVPLTRKFAARWFIGFQNRVTALIAVCLAMFALSSQGMAHAQQQGRHSSLELKSSDARLVKAFDWSKQEALSYVFDGDPVGPWYEAALPGRQAFCMRDLSHQAAGAQALGLSAYTHNMLRRFAENISASKDWCSYWEINNMNLPAPVDYKSDKEFWYNLPANFDVMDTCYRMYLWTGDETYLEDPVFLNFYDHTVTDYVSRWNLGVNRIMTRTNEIEGPPYFRGDPSYEESRPDVLLGVDLLATQYAGYRAYAAFQAIRGDHNAAKTYLTQASDVKLLVNTRWWNASGDYFYAFLDKDHKFHGRAGADLLYRDVVNDGPKAKSALETLLKTMQGEPASEVEPESHYAEILYRYGTPGPAYAEMMDLTQPGRKRQEYPEVSYSTIGAIVNGLMGINVEPALPIEDVAQGAHFGTVVSTLPQLTEATAWAELLNLPVRGGQISVRHDGERKTVLHNQGKTDLIWKAAFPGTFEDLMVNGKSVKCHSGVIFLGHPITWAMVPVRAGSSASVEVPQ